MIRFLLSKGRSSANIHRRLRAHYEDSEDSCEEVSEGVDLRTRPQVMSDDNFERVCELILAKTNNN